MLFFFLVENLVGSACNLQRLRMLLNKAVDMADTLLLQDFIHGNENARLLYIAEANFNGFIGITRFSLSSKCFLRK